MRSAALSAIIVAIYAAAVVAQEPLDAGAEGPEAPELEADAGAPEADADAEPVEEPVAAAKAGGPPEPSLNTRVSGRLRSELFLTQRPRMRSIGAGRYAIRSERVFPFYETFELRADEIGVKGLSVQFQGWAGIDLADVWFDNRLVADPTVLFVQYRDHGADIRLGRQLVYSGATRGLHLDGLVAAYETPAHVGIEVLGGLVVSPDLGPDWYRDPPASAGYDDYGAGFSDWDRDGDYAVGGRIFYRLAGRVSAGVSVLEVTELDEIDRRLFGVDLDFTPLSWLGATGNAVLDLAASRLQEANLVLDIHPIRALSFGADYRHADPTLYLSHMSIFSVFSTEEYDAVGGAVRVRPVEWLDLYAEYHHRFYSYLDRRGAAADPAYAAVVDTGYEVEGGAVARFGRTRAGRIVADYTRQGESDLGVHQLHGGLIIPIAVEGLRAVGNGYVDVFDDAWNAPYGSVDGVSGASKVRRLGFLVDGGLYYGTSRFEVGGYASHSATPYVRQETRGMLKFLYNFDVRFVGRGRP
ncbi:MAG: hypothetical protein M0R80_14310 [Proteobacteria bacterium]|nr:hypothetical protein [Pseudomonadota bacterium]